MRIVPADVPAEPLEVRAIVVDGPGVTLDRAQSPAGRSYRDPVGAYLASLSTDKSRRTAIESMRRIARVLGVQKDPRDHDAWRRIPWTRLTYAETNMVRAALVAHAKPATTRLTLSVLKRVLEEAFKLELIGAEQFQRAVLLERVRGQSARSGRELTAEDMERLEKHFSGLEEPFQTMLRALFAVGIGAGLRRAELAHVLVEGVGDGELRFVGKGMREAVQRVEDWAQPPLAAWLKARAALKLRAPTLFVRYDDKGEVLMDEPMTPPMVWALVTREARAAKIPKITTHDLRRTFGTRIIREADSIVAKNALRHVNMATTERYDRRGEDELREAMSKMTPMMRTSSPWSRFIGFVAAQAPGQDPLNAGASVVARFLRRRIAAGVRGIELLEEANAVGRKIRTKWEKTPPEIADALRAGR